MSSPSTDKYCAGCGKGLVATAQICPNCGTAA
ncbi:MAG: zinc ribbon domain-containing protein, partial [Microbacteriaceae bacterium]|nr:zinc ribbon domain-containing protein [Microbacteriaceae bacterium]